MSGRDRHSRMPIALEAYLLRQMHRVSAYCVHDMLLALQEEEEIKSLYRQLLQLVLVRTGTGLDVILPSVRPFSN